MHIFINFFHSPGSSSRKFSMEVPKDCFRVGAPRSVPKECPKECAQGVPQGVRPRSAPKECPKDCLRLGARVLLHRILGRKTVITITGRALGARYGARSWGAAWGAAWGAFSGLGRGMGRALGARHGARSWGATWGGLLRLSGTLQTVSKTRLSPE